MTNNDTEEFCDSDFELDDEPDPELPDCVDLPGLKKEIIENTKYNTIIRYTIPELPSKYHPEIVFDTSQYEPMVAGTYDPDGQQIALSFLNCKTKDDQEEIINTLKHEYAHYLEDKLYDLFRDENEFPKHLQDIIDQSKKSNTAEYSFEEPRTRFGDLEVLAYAVQNNSFRDILNIFLNRINTIKK